VKSWLRRFDEASVPAGPVQNVAQALEHEQSKAIGMVVDVEAPNGGTTRSLGLPIHFNGATQIASRAAPRVGQDSTDILRRFGFSDGEIDDLIASGAVLQAGASLDTAAATQG